MKARLKEIERQRVALQKAEEAAFHDICRIISKVCNKESSLVQKIKKNIFIVRSSRLVGNPWNLDYVSNEVAGETLLEKVRSIFDNTGSVDSVFLFLNNCIKAKGEDFAYVELNRWDKRPIRKTLIEEIIAAINAD